MSLLASCLNRSRFYLLLLATLVLSGCAILGWGTRPGVVTGASVRLTAQAAGPAGVAGQVFESHLRRDGRDLGVVHAGSEPVWEWTPQEPGEYRTRTVVRDPAGKVLAESGWSAPYEVVRGLKVERPTVDRPAPQTAGMAIRWRAAASGGAGKKTYEFRLRRGEGEAATVQSGRASEWLWSPEQAGHYQVQVVAVDAHGNRAESDWSDLYEVVPRLAVKALNADRPAAQAAGTAIRWTAQASGGVGAIAYTFELRSGMWMGKRVQSGPLSEWLWSPVKAGRYRVRVMAVDARGNRAKSDWSAPYEITPKLAVKPLAVKPAAPRTAGAAISWTTAASGGVGEVAYQFELRPEGEAAAAVQTGPSLNWLWNPAQPGRYQVRAVAVDARGNRAESVWSAPYEVLPRLKVERPTIDRPAPQTVGTAIRWTAAVSGGVGKKTYEFRLRHDEGEGTTVQAGRAPEWLWSPQQVGRYQVQAVVVDAHGNRAASDWSDPYEVVSRLAVKTPEADRRAVQAVGTTIRWTAQASGGAGEIAYTFELRSGKTDARKTQSGPSSEWFWSPGQPGRYQVRSVAVDARGNRAESDWSAPYEIVPKLVVTSLTPSLNDPQAANRSTITWSATAAGGVGERTFRFMLGPEGGAETETQTGPASTWEWEPAEAGRYRVSVVVRDSLGNRAVRDWPVPYEITPLLPLGELAHDRPAPQMVGSSPITWEVTTAAEVTEKLTYEFHLRRDGGKEIIAQKGPSPIWQWVPTEPGTYQVKVLAEGASGLVMGSGWSKPYPIMRPSIAVLPVDNLSGAGGTPVKQLREALKEKLKKQGLTLLEDDLLEQFMTRHRIRYVGGIDTATAKAFLSETGANAVLVTSLELYNETDPPKIALTCRLVSTGESPKIIWIDGVGMAGDDAPGILELGVIHDHRALWNKAIDFLVGSMGERLAGKTGRAATVKVPRRFQPKIAFNASFLKQGKKYTVGVLPFINMSERNHAGEILALNFVRHLASMDGYTVLEPGVVREKLLALRIIMREGISRTDLNTIANSLETDMMLSGKVNRYQDLNLPGGVPTVAFSAMLMERMDKKVIWSSTSYNQGNDGVFFFDAGRVSTAFETAAKMVRSILAQLERSRGEPGKGLPGEPEPIQEFRRKP
jgi:hypothetical protein